MNYFPSDLFPCFPGDSAVKNPTTKQETWVPSLGGRDPLEKEMATHSSTHAWKIPWTEEPGGLQSIGSQKSPTQLSDQQQNLQQWLITLDIFSCAY